MADSGRDHIDPRLLAFMDKAETEKGIFVQDLKEGDVLEVDTTSGTTYTLKVLDPAHKKVEATSNGTKFTEPTETYANGSSLTGTGSMIKMGWVAPSYRLLLGNRLLTSTERVRLNGVQILPRERPVVA